MHDEERPVGAESWLSAAPVAVVALDGDGRVAWLNAAAARLLGGARQELLGQTAGSLAEPLRAVLFGSDGDCALRAADGAERWLRVSSSTGVEPAGWTVKFLQDRAPEQALAAENQSLRQQVEALRLTDDATGLPNRRALRQQLELHVSRSRRYGNPLTLLYVRLAADDGEKVAEDAVVAAGRYLRDRLRWVDQIARWGDAEFLIVLPETGEDEAARVAANLFAAPEALDPPARTGGGKLSLRHGMANWTRGDDVRMLLQRAQDAVDAGSRTEVA
jgi:diguanylate cyclase (GGDEF)-like protein